MPHHCLQESLVDLQSAFGNFYAGRAGDPSPRGNYDTQSFRFPDPKQFTIQPSGDRQWADVRFPKLGKSKGDHGALRVRLHRPLEGRIKSATLVLEGDHCDVSFLVEVHGPDPVAPAGPKVGVDRGVAVPLMRSDGVAPYVPVPTLRQEERQRRLQRSLSRKEKGSRNRAKARRILAWHEAAVARRRRDALHKATTVLARNHREVVLQDLRVTGMTASARGMAEEPGTNVTQKAGLNRAILARGWGTTRQMLAYKTGWYGSTLHAVPPPGTSQTCSECGLRDPGSRVSRDLFCCTGCGHKGYADLNAAKVIRGPQEGADHAPDPYLVDLFGLEAVLAGPPPPTTLEVACPEDSSPDPACGDLCASMSAKQERRAVRPGSHVLQGVV